MPQTLHVGQQTSWPLKVLSLRKVVFGGSGSGKTSSGRVLFEEATAAGVLCGAIDLKGDWWGLKSSASGAQAAIPIVIFGGDHQDVPLDEAGGASLAEIVVDLRQPFVIDLENLSKGKQLRFLGVFFDRLYDKNREPLVLFCDEADRYAPQKPMSPEANICLGATEDIAKRGRSHGIFPIFITQRNASLNKSVSELCDVALVFRTPGPRDQAAVDDWFSTNATKAQRDEVMAKLAGLPTGTAIVCSAHPDLKLFETVTWRRPTTFDSSATPEIGKRRIEPKRLAQPDLDKLRTRMAATIERAKADDPRELRRRIMELEGSLRTAQRNTPVTVKMAQEKRIEVPVLPARLATRLETLARKMLQEATKHGHAMAAFWSKQEECWKAVLGAVQSVQSKPQSIPHEPPTVREAARRIATEALRYGTPTVRLVSVALDQAILNALGWWQAFGVAAPTRQQASFVAGRTIGGHFNNCVSRLHTAGLLEYPTAGCLALTADGRARAHLVGTPPSRDVLFEMVRAMLGTDLKRQIFDVLVAFNKPVTREEIAERVGRTIGGHFNNSVSRLSSLGLVIYPSRGLVALSPQITEVP